MSKLQQGLELPNSRRILVGVGVCGCVCLLAAAIAVSQQGRRLSVLISISSLCLYRVEDGILNQRLGLAWKGIPDPDKRNVQIKLEMHPHRNSCFLICLVAFFWSKFTIYKAVQKKDANSLDSQSEICSVLSHII